MVESEPQPQKSQKKVEEEETVKYVKEKLGLSQEDAEAISKNISPNYSSTRPSDRPSA